MTDPAAVRARRDALRDMANDPDMKPCQPFTDDGTRLATIPRGPNRELRIGLKEYKGHQFLRLQEWSVNPHNAQWWPEKGKGCSIKRREVEAVIAALVKARDRLGETSA